MSDLPKKMQDWLNQPGSVLTQNDSDFIGYVRLYAKTGVGYGFMQQVVEWLWQEACELRGLPAGSSWGPEHFQAEIAKLTAERDELLAFKTYAHKRLDDAGVPVDPESSHKAEGCRIGGRLDAVFAERDKLKAVLVQVAIPLEVFCMSERVGGQYQEIGSDLRQKIHSSLAEVREVIT